MYKDNSSAVSEPDEDVEFIADVGYIASRVQLLEEKYLALFDVGLDVDEATLSPDFSWGGGLGTFSGGGQRVVITTEQQQKINNSTATNTLSDPRARKRLLEKLLVNFYEDYERTRPNQLKGFMMSSGDEKLLNKINGSTSEGGASGDGNLGNTTTTTTTTTTSQSADEEANTSSTTGISGNKSRDRINQSEEEEDDEEEEFIEEKKRKEGEEEEEEEEEEEDIVDIDGVKKSSTSANNSAEGYTRSCIPSTSDSYSVGSGSGTGTGTGATTIKEIDSSSASGSGIAHSSGSGSGYYPKQSTFIVSSSGNTESSVPSDSYRSEYNLVQLKNTIIQCQFNEEDLRAVVRDLKRKVEYTERMNWLYLSRRPMGPPHRKSSLPKHTEVKKRFLQICDNTLSDEVKAALRLPAFDSYDWADADVIHLMQTMFMELGLIEKFNIPIATLREWLYEVYKHYNEVPFHNFRHCFCVAQMMYAIARQTNLITRLGELEVLILLVSCICHDLDHPGYNNIYQINARTELALRYNDISPLENHHCSIAFRLLEHPECNIFKHFNRETFNIIREGIIRCILATDMARHNEILTQFKDVVPTFDYSNRAHINLLCMVLIKVADISNEARPMDVAEPWLDRLLTEFFAQSAAEKSEGLPVTPFMDPDKVSKPGSQVRFIGLVLLPLFEALGELLPELTELIIIPVRVALDYYKRLNDAQAKSRKSLAEANENSSDGGGSPQLPRSQSGISVKSKRSIPSQKSASRTSVDETTCIAAELHDLPEGSESGDSETATEVDVAEKTSKFKVDTEGSSNRSKSSHSTSRKSSREKRPSMISEMCSSGGRMRNSYGNIHGYHSNRYHFSSNRAVSLDQYSCNNRRLSDGLQQVISDSNVFYNRHNRGNDSDANNTEKPKILESNVVILGEDVINMNTSNQFYDNSGSRQPIVMQTNSKSANNGSGGGNGNCSQNGKTWKARFKQLTDIFSFSFDKGNKRFISSTRSSPCSIRNNNADNPKPGICCTISNNLSPSLKQKQDLINAGRNRAYSLDVPSRNRYSSSSGGDSRKSSRNEENSIRHDPLTEDNNSNNTSSGEVPSAHLRMGSDTAEVKNLTNVMTSGLDVGAGDQGSDPADGSDSIPKI